MNILLVCGSMSIYSGGPPRVVAGTAKALATKGHNITIATLAENNAKSEIIFDEFPLLMHDNITVKMYKKSFPSFMKRSSELIKIIRDHLHEYDLVHVHGIWELFIGELFLLCQRQKIPFFISTHGLLDPWAMKQSSWKKKISMEILPAGRMMQGANAIIYATNEERIWGRKLLNTKSHVVPNGIDVNSLNRENLPDDKKLRQIYPQLNKWNRVFLFYSRIHPKKGLHLLIESFLSLENVDDSVGLLIVGIPQDKPYENALRTLVSNSPHRDRIIFTTELVGKESQVALKCADIFVLPSYQEGFSMSILEAMACELPVLISDQCHFSEVETEWNAGFVVRQDIESLTEGLVKMLSLSKKELKEMGIRGREAIVKNYDWNAVAERLEKLYLGDD